MDVISKLIARAREEKQRIVLPEGTEERTLKAADQAIADGIADLIILGNKAEINALAEKFGLANIKNANIIDPDDNPDDPEIEYNYWGSDVVGDDDDDVDDYEGSGVMGMGDFV